MKSEGRNRPGRFSGAMPSTVAPRWEAGGAPALGRDWPSNAGRIGRSVGHAAPVAFCTEAEESIRAR